MSFILQAQVSIHTITSTLKIPPITFYGKLPNTRTLVAWGCGGCTIRSIVTIEKYEHLCAFQPPPYWEQPRHSGWVMYDAVGEYARMGIPNQHWVMSDLNDNYEVGVAHL